MHKYSHSTCTIKRSELLWDGAIIPTPLSNEYMVHVKYKVGESPGVYVKKPILQRYGDSPLPHVYDAKNQKLCIYYPGEWKPTMHISDTIVPWASEWLLFYELWLTAGEWLGGGVHPVTKKSRKKPEIS